MALEFTLPAEQNPTNDTPIPLYVRGTGLTLDLANGYAQAPFVGYASEAARHAGKQPVYQFQGLQIGPVPQPPQFDPQTGVQVRGGSPSLPQLLGVFAAEFNAVSTILYCLAKRLDPQLQNATDLEADFDADLVAEIDAKLDILLGA